LAAVTGATSAPTTSVGERHAMRIAIASESDAIGGAETMILHLAATLRSRGHEVHFIGPEPTRHWHQGWLSDQMRAAGVPTHLLPLGQRRFLACVRGTAALLRRHRIDVLHSHMFGMSVLGTAASRLARVPHVITMHGTGTETSAARRRVALAAAFRASAGVVAVSQGLKSQLHDQLGHVADRMRIIANGIPHLAGDRWTLRRELRVADDEILVVAVGNLFHNKAHINLFRALAELPEDARWRVAIAGAFKEAEPDLRAFIAARGWEGRAHLLGPRTDIPDLLAAADVYCMPSLNEALPMALLEAMASGKPIVASRVGGIPEAVSDGRDALLVPPGDVGALADALGHLLGNSALRAGLGGAARARADAEFSVDTMTAAYERLFDEVSASTRSPRRARQ
jgi:glycosyltransferase involved in cell wall biosynthesis